MLVLTETTDTLKARAEECPTLRVPILGAGVHNLINTPMVVDGSRLTRVAAYTALDATISQWTARQGITLPTIGGGVDNVVDLPSPYPGPLDELLRWGGAKVYQAGNNAFGNVSSWDMVVEWFGWFVSNSKTHLSKYGANLGYQLDLNASALSLAIGCNGSYTYTSTRTLEPNCLQLCHWFLKRTGYGQAYVWASRNGCAPVDISSRSGNCDAAQPFTIGATPAGTALADGGLGLLQIWTGTLSTHIQDALTAYRVALLTGHAPSRSTAGLTAPAVYCASPGHQRRRIGASNTRVFYMGQNTPRTERVADGSATAIDGALVEGASTNSHFPSSGAFRTVTNATDTLGAMPTAYKPEACWSKLVEDNTNSYHYAYHDTNLGGSGDCAGAVLLKKEATGYRRYIMVGIQSNLTTWDYVIVDMDNGTISAWKNLGAEVMSCKMATIEQVQTGEYLVRLTCYSAGAVNKRFGVGLCDNGTAFGPFQGDNVTFPNGVNHALVQFEMGSYPSSHIPTVGAAASRVAGQLYYPITTELGATQGAMRCKFLFPPSYPSTATAQNCLLEVTTPSGAYRFLIFRDAASGTVSAYAAFLGGSTLLAASGSPNVLDNAIHEVMLTWSGAVLDLWLDGVKATTSLAAMPSGLTRFYVANSVQNAPAGPAVVSEARLYNEYQTEWTPSSLPSLVCFRDLDASNWTPGRTPTNVTATDVTIQAAPAAGHSRLVSMLALVNTRTVRRLLTISFDANGTAYPVWKGELGPDEAVRYEDGTGWSKATSSGALKTLRRRASVPDAPPLDVQVFDTVGSFTWTKPTSFTPKVVYAEVIGGGGGGGGGSSGSGGQAQGGGGGGGGAVCSKVFVADDLGATESVVVGAAGTVGAGGTAGGGGGTGGPGGMSQFGPLKAYGGGGGYLGSPFSTANGGGGGGGVGGVGADATMSGGAGGNPQPYGTPDGDHAFAGCGAKGGGNGVALYEGYHAECGGGGGGGHNNSMVSGKGGSAVHGAGGGGGGGGYYSGSYSNAEDGGACSSTTAGGGGSKGTSGNPSTAGSPGASSGLVSGAGGGGGGGGFNCTGSQGGAGGAPGGGGGGGGGAATGGSAYNGGAGGLGGRGEVRVYSW